MSTVLAKFAGRERKLFDGLRKKYGAAPDRELWFPAQSPAAPQAQDPPPATQPRAQPARKAAAKKAAAAAPATAPTAQSTAGDSSNRGGSGAHDADGADRAAKRAKYWRQVAQAKRRKALRRFYAEHSPERVEQVDAVLERFEGREEELFEGLTLKYGVGPDDALWCVPTRRGSAAHQGSRAARQGGAAARGGRARMAGWDSGRACNSALPAFSLGSARGRGIARGGPLTARRSPLAARRCCRYAPDRFEGAGGDHAGRRETERQREEEEERLRKEEERRETPKTAEQAAVASMWDAAVEDAEGGRGRANGGRREL